MVGQGIEIMDAECEELTLKVERVSVEEHLERSKATQGYLALLAKTHTGAIEEVPQDTIWVGGLPESILGETPEAAVSEMCTRIGESIFEHGGDVVEDPCLRLLGGRVGTDLLESHRRSVKTGLCITSNWRIACVLRVN